MTCIRCGTLHKVNSLLKSISRFQHIKSVLHLCQTSHKTDSKTLIAVESRGRIETFRRLFSTGNNFIQFDGNIPIRQLQFTYSLSSGPGKDDLCLENQEQLQIQQHSISDASDSYFLRQLLRYLWKTPYEKLEPTIEP